MTLINREVLLRKLDEEEKRICRESFAECPYKDPYDLQALNEIRILRRIVSNSDSCRAEPSDKGEWVPYLRIWKCSVCNQLLNLRYAFCPYCGAEMER